ncbi:tRNA uridine-5-carboxymethylaminomethyl(34) synthesis GTPase MnmE [Litorimonas sp. RW-G-Af-16]|uniref:tRNA uridine-5-carboxymethylaminomethyl(34) synthesis GTPase MnmE n=1 Tax=Litorimonas sp. RW-G-Af-16 TaxID=3241168 RepID=UPI00390C54FE
MAENRRDSSVGIGGDVHSENALTETIFALSSAPGRAGVSVFRLSGPKASSALQSMTKSALPRPRQAALRSIYDVEGEMLDAPLVLWFPAPKSFTGEDCVELQVHGSPAVIEGVAAALQALGLRQALPGEFTRRAVENGKMDLTEAEGLADLIDAETDGQRRQAIRQMDGQLRQTYEGWRDDLLDAMAQIEGEIDFADEADVPDALSHAAYPILKNVSEAMTLAIANVGRGEAIRNGIEIAIIGAPNAGKSTLMNTLAKRDVAITSPEAGTTRDVVEVQMRLAGLPVTLLDTAGLRETENLIEAEGVKRARARASAANIRIWVQRPGIEDGNEFNTLMSRDDIKIYNISEGYEADVSNPNIITNAQTGQNIDALLSKLEDIITERYTQQEHAGLTRQRHKSCVLRALENTDAAMDLLAGAPELASENIRAALSALEELAGVSDIEQVFDRIFSRFCIGK